MIHIPGKIPVTIRGGFWLVAALIGFLNSWSLIGTFLWIIIIFVSVLVHEFGHAILSLSFGQHPRIELIPFGGVTFPEGKKIKLWKEFIVVFAGPFFGFLLFVLATFLLTFMNQQATPMLFIFVKVFQVVNLFWTVVNLLPILPLDGGQLMRIILEGIFKHKALRYTLFVSMVVSAGFSLFFFLYGAFLVGAIFFLFAFQNFETYRRTKLIAPSDTKEPLKELLQKGELLLMQGNKDEARRIFEDLRAQSEKGMLFSAATQRLAQMEAEVGRYKEAYEMLSPIQSDVREELYPLFQKGAYEAGDYKLVEKLGNVCYRNTPNAEIAIRNASASAALGKTKAAIGWLKASLREGATDLMPIIDDKLYDSIRNEAAFKSFVASILRK